MATISRAAAGILLTLTVAFTSLAAPAAATDVRDARTGPSSSGTTVIAASAAGLSWRANKFAQRWGRAFNRGDWQWLRQHSNPENIRIRELKRNGFYRPVTFAWDCEWIDGMRRNARLCGFDSMELEVARRSDGTLRARRHAFYR
jgi:hypothetical protein